MYVSPQVGGGSVESLLQLVANLNAEKFETTVLFERFADSDLRRRFVRAGADVINLVSEEDGRVRSGNADARPRLRRRVKKHISAILVRFYSEILSVLQFARSVLPRALRIRKVIRRVKPDIVHVNSAPHSGLAGIFASRLQRVPCVCHIRNLSNLSIIQKWASSSVCRFVFISTAVQQHMLEQGVGTTNGQVVFNGVDIEEYQSAGTATFREDLGVSDDTLLVAIVGRLDHWKGHGVFIDSIDKLRSRGYRLKGLIIGASQSSPRNQRYVKDLQAQVEDGRLEEVIAFLGPRRDMPAIMQEIDVLVLASTEPEPFGRVVIEAMAAGTPVVATAAGGILDIIRDRKTGYLVPAADIDAMAAAIEEAHTDPEGRIKIIEAAKAEVEQRFSSKHYAEEIVRIYDEELALSRTYANDRR